MNGRVVSVPRPSAKQFDYTIEWDTSHLLDGFTIAKYPIFTSVANTHAPKIHIQLDTTRATTSNYTFTEPISQILQR